jgi:hypothetical protein
MVNAGTRSGAQFTITTLAVEMVVTMGQLYWCDTSKIRRAGFYNCLDSEEMMLKLLADFRAQKIVP